MYELWCEQKIKERWRSREMFDENLKRKFKEISNNINITISFLISFLFSNYTKYLHLIIKI